MLRAHMPRRSWPVVLSIVLLAAPAFAQPSEIRKSLARITNTAQEPNYRIPWLPGATAGSA